MHYKVYLTDQQIMDVSKHRMFTNDLMIIDDGCIIVTNYTSLVNILNELKIKFNIIKVEDKDSCYFCL